MTSELYFDEVAFPVVLVSHFYGHIYMNHPLLRDAPKEEDDDDSYLVLPSQSFGFLEYQPEHTSEEAYQLQTLTLASYDDHAQEHETERRTSSCKFWSEKHQQNVCTSNERDTC